MDERIIECVRSRELLYNYKLKDYKHASKKQEVWEEIAAELNITATECKTKWSLLRNAFIHAMSRRKTITGQGVRNFNKWKFEDEMAFLLPFMGNRNTVAAPVGEFSHETSESPGAEIIEESLNENNIQQKKRHLDNYHEDMLKLMKARSQRRSEKNDIDLFFNSIAETFKKFPKLEQVKLKFKVMNLVHEIEMKMCLESDGASISTPPHFSRHTFSPHNFSPSPQSFDTHYSPSSPVTQQISSPPYVPQSSPSPQIAYSSSPSIIQQVSSPQFIPLSSPSPQISHFTSHTTLSLPATQQVSSPQFIPQPSPAPHMTYHTASPPNIQPSTSQTSQSLSMSNTQDAVVEISIPELNSQQASEKTSARRYHKGPAHTVLKEFLILKREINIENENNNSLSK